MTEEESELWRPKILPAIRSMKDFDKMLDTSFQYGVFLDLHVGMLKSVLNMPGMRTERCFFIWISSMGCPVTSMQRNIFVRKSNRMESFRPKEMWLKSKAKGVFATQRMFVIDSSAMNRGIELIRKTDPDFIEVLPGSFRKSSVKLPRKPANPFLRAVWSTLLKKWKRPFQQARKQSPPQTGCYGNILIVDKIRIWYWQRFHFGLTLVPS